MLSFVTTNHATGDFEREVDGCYEIYPECEYTAPTLLEAIRKARGDES